MNEESGGSKGSAERTECESTKSKTASGSRGKEKENQERVRGAQGRSYSSKQRRGPKSKDHHKQPQDGSRGQSANDDKDVISWLNKKITKQDKNVETGRNTKYSKNAKHPQTQHNRAKVENWRDRDVDMRGASESSRENPGHRKSEQEKYRKNGRFREQHSSTLDTDSRKQSKHFSSNNRDRNNIEIGEENTEYQIEMPTHKKGESGTHDVVEIGANVNVVNGKYVGKNRHSEQQDNGTAMVDDAAQYGQYTDMGMQPQVYVYGGLHVYNMPNIDQQYHPGGQQWYNYAEQSYQNWNQQWYQPYNHNTNADNKSKEYKVKEKNDPKIFSRTFKEQKRNVIVDPNHSVQASVLTEQLLNESYECMVCCEKIRCHASVWSCANCYHVFHLRCVRKWAISPAALVEGTGN